MFDVGCRMSAIGGFALNLHLKSRFVLLDPRDVYYSEFRVFFVSVTECREAAGRRSAGGCGRREEHVQEEHRHPPKVQVACHRVRRGPRVQELIDPIVR